VKKSEDVVDGYTSAYEPLYKVEQRMFEHYKNVENEIRNKHGVESQEKIELIIEDLIRDGALPKPFVIEKNGELIKSVILPHYTEYKKYRAIHKIDTTVIFDIHMDSLGIIKQ